MLFAAMVGDVNIFMNDTDNPQMAEIEIMIAEQKRYILWHSCHKLVADCCFPVLIVARVS